jgi:hypothetical protein
MTSRTYVHNNALKIVMVLLLFGFGALLHGCKPELKQYTSAKEGNEQSAVTEVQNASEKLALRESNPLDKGNKWRTGVYEKRNIGYCTKGSGCRINHTFGIEQWENGKRTTHRFQLWRIRCGPPVDLYEKNRTKCFLERLVIDDFVNSLGGALLSEHYHSEQEGNLKLSQIDWREGRLDFSLTYDDQATEEVSIRFSRSGDSLVLESFKAVSLGRGFFSGEPQSVEHKVAEYTYVLNVPVLIEGMYDAGLKQWDKLFAALSPTDQAAWNELIKSPQFKNYEFPQKEYESRLKSALPKLDIDAYNNGKQQLSKEEQQQEDQVSKSIVVERYEKLLSESRLSADAKRIIGNYIAANI